MFEGIYIDNKKEGPGEMTYTRQNMRFIGEWHDDLPAFGEMVPIGSTSELNMARCAISDPTGVMAERRRQVDALRTPDLIALLARLQTHSRDVRLVLLDDDGTPPPPPIPTEVEVEAAHVVDDHKQPSVTWTSTLTSGLLL